MANGEWSLETLPIFSVISCDLWAWNYINNPPFELWSPCSESPSDLGPFQSEIISAEIFYSWGLSLHVKIHIFISNRVCLSRRLHNTETSLCTVMTQLCLTFNCWAIARLLFLLRFPNRSNSLKAASSLVIYFFLLYFGSFAMLLLGLSCLNGALMKCYFIHVSARFSRLFTSFKVGRIRWENCLRFSDSQA